MAADPVDPDRPPLREAALSQDLIRPGGLWQQIRVVQVTGSTNADLLAEAAAGAAGGRVLVAEAQTAGRLERQWVSPPRASLTFSVLVRPTDLPPAPRAWIPLFAGVAVASALRRSAAVDARLKWPNDVLVGEAKLAGILAETRRDAVVVGVGINVTLRRQDLPVPGATSLLLAGAAETGRELVLGAVLRELKHWYLAWAGGTDPDASGLRAEYRQRCATIGRQVRVELPGGRALTGVADDVNAGPAGRADRLRADVGERRGRRARPLRQPGGRIAIFHATMCRMAGGDQLSEGERSVLILHPHWKTLLWPILVLVAVVAAALAVVILIPAGQAAEPGRIAVGGVAFVAVLLGFVVPYLRWQTTSYQLTTRRFRLRYGILTRTGRDFPLIRISDVSFSQGPIDRLLGCGRLTVESAGEHGQLVLNEIPEVKKVQATLFQLVEDEQRRLARDERQGRP